MLSSQDFLKVDVRSGTVVRAEEFPEAIKPAYRLWVDFGTEIGIRTASAQLTKLYNPSDLQGKQVLAVVNFPPRQVANFVSQVLVLGLPDRNGDAALLQPDRPVPNGVRVF